MNPRPDPGSGDAGAAPAKPNAPMSMHWRAAHRARQHEQAHEEDGAAEPQAPTPNLPLVPRQPAEVIATAPALEHLCRHLREEGRFAYDSEFIGELTYVPKLCLIQIATPSRIALVDPLADLDLTPVWELICDPTVQKIVHAGQQDIEPAVRHLGRRPANVFDTQIACGFLGLGYPIALAKIVHENLAVRIGKGLTFTHWDQRPLSRSQMRYAADDVRYLCAVHSELIRRLEKAGHLEWALEECEAQCDPKLFEFDPDAVVRRMRGSGNLPAKALGVLRELIVWRDSAARNHNLPPRALVRDEVLVDMARSPVKTVEKLARVRGLPRPVEQAHGAELIEATQRGLADPAPHLATPKAAEMLPREKFRLDGFWSAVQCLCHGRGLDPALVTSRQEVLELLATAGSPRPPDLRLLSGWRRAALGDALLGLLHGELKLEMDWNKHLRVRPSMTNDDTAPDSD